MFNNVKPKSLLIMSVMMLVLLTGCGNTPAATDEPVTDTSVQEDTLSAVAEETVHEHTWAEATCTQPRTCTECGATEGEPIDHEWTYATLESPKTCVNCGATEGDPIVCKQLDVESIIGSGWDRWVPYPESIICGKRLTGSSIQVTFFDYDGNKINEYSLDFTDKAWGYSILTPFKPEECVIAVQTSSVDVNNEVQIVLYDQMGNIIKEHNFHYDLPYDDSSYVSLTTCTDIRYAAVLERPSNKVIKYIDTQDLSLVESAQVNTTLINDDVVTYDESKFSHCSKMRNGYVNGYLVSSADETKWGYVDENFNEIAMYADATDFTVFGYALVSEDGTNYDIIDKDFNVIAHNYIQGKGAYIDSDTINGAVITLLTDDGKINLYIR